MREIGRLYRVEGCSLSLLADDQSLRSVRPYVEGEVDERGRNVLDELSSRGSIKGSLVGAVLDNGKQAFVWNAYKGEDFAELSEEALTRQGVSLDRKAARLLRDRVLPSRRLRNILAVPMRRGTEKKGDSVGCILLLNRVDGDPFGSEEVESLETIARQVAIAVTNFYHHRLNLRHTEQERFFNQLLLTDDLDELFQRVLRYLNETYNSRVASLWLATEDGFGTPEETIRVVLRSVAVAPFPGTIPAGELEGKLKRHSIFRLDGCFIGDFFRDNHVASEVRYIEDLRTVEDCWASLREDIGTNRLIAIPLRRFPADAGETDEIIAPPLGVACLRPLEPVNFDEAQRKQLERFANHLAVLMEQVRYRRRYVQLETLKDSLPSLERDDLSAFYYGLVNLVRKVLNAEVCSYFTLGPEGELILKATTAERVKRLAESGKWEILETARFVDQIAYPAGEKSITGVIAELRETVLIYNVHENKEMSTRFMEVGETPDHQSLIGAPIIKSDGTLLGVLRCINKKKEGSFLHVFVQGDRDFLELTVGIMARFIENAEADESKRDFLNQLAHELASPLAALRTQIEFLEEVSKGGRHVRDPEEQFGYLKEQSDYIQYIVSDIQYQFGRGSAIRASYEFSRLVDLAPMIERLKKLLLPFARMDKQIDIITGTSRLPSLYVDARRMEQVVFNLLQNAVKYSRAGGRDIFVGYDSITELGADVPIQWHRLSVQNFGIGVRKVDEEFIFDEYRRGSNVEGSPSGTGLGLAVAKKIVEAHCGRLKLTQRHNPTIFAVDLPAYLAKEPPEK